MKVLIVGGVAGGASAAARLRRLDEAAEIVIFERGDYISFANCGLPYFIGGDITNKQALTLQTPKSFKDRFNVDVRVNSEVTAIDTAEKTITVKDGVRGTEYTESYDRLILSPGAQPIIPPIPGLKSERVFTLRNIPDTMKIQKYIDENKPKRAAVIGGGYIGMEMAENLRKRGMAVSVVELSDHLIAPLDFEMAAEVHVYARNAGIDLYLSNGLQSIREEGGELNLELAKGQLRADMLIMSVGVRPDTGFLEGSGIALTERGAIITDAQMRTNQQEVYAVGDAVQVNDFVTGTNAVIPLAGPANKQGRIAADNISGADVSYTGTQGTAILKLFEMTVATTGLNERSARIAGIDYDKTHILAASNASYYPGSSPLSMKLLWDKKDGRIIGAQIVGYQGVDKRIDVIATAMRFGATVHDLTKLELAYAPPFGSAKDPVNMIGFTGENITSGKMKQAFFEDIAMIRDDADAVILDVRTPHERMAGHIEGSMHIALDDLRENIDKIPKDKKIYVHCQSGLRSYIACRILEGRGISAWNLSGGYRQYSFLENEKKYS